MARAFLGFLTYMIFCMFFISIVGLIGCLKFDNYKWLTLFAWMYSLTAPYILFVCMAVLSLLLKKERSNG